MRIYVASRFKNYERAREVIDELTDRGFQITYDWTRTDEFDENGKPYAQCDYDEVDQDQDAQRRYAYNDKRGVKNADVLVLLAQDDIFGALIETGMAFAYGARIVVVNPDRHSIFWTLPQVRVVDTEEELYEYLERSRAGRRSAVPALS